MSEPVIASTTDGASEEIASTLAKYGAATSPLQMSIGDAECLSIVLAERCARGVPPFDLVVGIANGALLMTKVVAETLEIPFEMVKIRHRGSRYKQQLLKIKDALHLPTAVLRWGPLNRVIGLFQDLTGQLEEAGELLCFPVNGKRILLVDDCVVTGTTLTYVAKRLLEAGATDAVTSVLCWCDVPGRAVPQPDVYLHRQIHIYPWSGDSHSLAEFRTWLAGHQLSLWQ